MAYPTGAEIRAMLPVPDPAVTEAECSAFVSEWVGAVEDAAGNPTDENGNPVSVESWRTRRIVREGALADAEWRLFTLSGYYGEPDAIRAKLARVENMLKSYDVEHSTPAETEREAPQGYTGVMW